MADLKKDPGPMKKATEDERPIPTVSQPPKADVDIPVTYFAYAANAVFVIQRFAPDDSLTPGKPIGAPITFEFHNHLLTLTKRSQQALLESSIHFAGNTESDSVEFMRENEIDKPSLEAARKVAANRYTEGAVTVSNAGAEAKDQE